jgi:NAD(P) transhydrogenase subunit alpha
MDPQLVEGAKKLAEQANELAASTQAFAGRLAEIAAEQGGHGNFVSFLTVFVLACFVGYYVVWRVTPALHSPLMAVTNAISSVIIVGAILAAGSEDWGASKLFGFLAVTLASVNIFGGFIVTERMLAMFKKKDPK